ncbi:MAG: S-layer homology domain-containing protein, partial [Oscillospiraceae bacterium]|nr:S-layer homology domain-containing protein [Oscillospiraceae bacterium]
MKKKILSILLVLSVWCSLMPALSVSVSAAMVNYTPEVPTSTTAPASAEEVEARLSQLITKYDGTNWTSTGQPCESHREACYSKYYNAWQCNGFARYIFSELFCTADIGSYDGNDPYYIPKPRNAVEVFRTTYTEKDNTAAMKSLLAPAMAGDFLQIYDRETGRPHSMIVVSVAAHGVNVLDCNSDGHCGVKYQLLSWKYMAARYEKLSLYRLAKYPAPTASFFDVSKNDWFYNSVVWAKAAGVTGGKTATTFAPYE